MRFLNWISCGGSVLRGMNLGSLIYEQLPPRIFKVRIKEGIFSLFYSYIFYI